MLHPSLNGSVFDAFIIKWMLLCLNVMSSKHRVVLWSYFCVCDDTYSEDLRNPKKAVVTADHSISLSWCVNADFTKYVCTCVRSGSVTGKRLCFLCDFLFRLMDLTSMYSLGRLNPCWPVRYAAKCFIAARCKLMLLSDVFEM